MNRAAAGRLAILSLLAVLLRLAAVFTARDGILDWPRSDPDDYGRLAFHLAHTGVFGGVDESGAERPSAYRPPLYPILLTPFFASTHPWLWGVVLLHLIAGAITVLATWRLAALAAPTDEPSAIPLTAGLLVAVDPLSIHQGAQLMTETVFTALLTVSLVLWLDRAKMKQTWKIPLTGILIGLAALTRPTAWPLWGAVGLATFVLDRRRCREWITTALIAVGVCLPWIVRNAMLLGAPIAATTHGGYTLWLGYNPSFYAHEVLPWAGDWGRTESFQQWTAENDRRVSALDEVRRDAAYRRLALEWIASDPTAALKTAAYHVACLWSPSPRAGPERLRSPVAFYYVCQLGTAALGLWMLRARPKLASVLAALLAALTVVHAVFWSNIRMRTPITPILATLAALAVDGLWRYFQAGRRLSKR